MLAAMKRTVAIVVVASLGAAAPSVASADQWYADGNLVGSAPGVAVVGSGSLSHTIPVGGGATMTTTCDVEVAAELFNQGGAAHGEVMGLSVPVPGDCVLSSSPGGIIGNCRVAFISATASPLTPWTIDTAGANVTITGVTFFRTLDTGLGGPTCALTGSKTVTGNVTGTWSNPGTWTFSGATGLMVNPGSVPSTVNGSLLLEGEAGEEITLL